MKANTLIYGFPIWLVVRNWKTLNFEDKTVWSKSTLNVFCFNKVKIIHTVTPQSSETLLFWAVGMSGWLQPPASLGTALISPATDRQMQVFSAGGWAAAGLILRCTQTVCKNETKKWNMELQHQSVILLPRVDAALMSAAEKNQMIPERSDSGGQAATEPKRQPEFGSNWENWALLVQLMAHIFRAQWRKYLALNSK